MLHSTFVKSLQQDYIMVQYDNAFWGCLKFHLGQREHFIQECEIYSQYLALSQKVEKT